MVRTLRGVKIDGRAYATRMRWLAKHVGRRGAFLAFLALLDYLYGYSILSTPVPQRRLDLFLPFHVWGIIWIAVGIVCTTGVFMRFDFLQFMAASAIKIAWSLIYVKLWLADNVPRSWVSSVIWAAFAFTVVLVSGWPEPPPKLPPLPPRVGAPS